MFKRYEELVEYVFSLVASRDYSLEKVKKWAELLANPQDSYKIIHITGTNGKWSVANMCFSILKQAKKSVGIFTSPHLEDIRERFITNKGMISKSDFLKIGNRILSLELNFSYFEMCTLLAFVYFQEQGCEYAIIEVWFWWLLDSTNIVSPTITCITSIGLDHQKYLGNTVEEIAYQKSGIIKTGIPIVINAHNSVIESVAQERGSPVLFAAEEKNTNLLWDHQRKNAALAYEITNYLGISQETILQWLQLVVHRGRLEYICSNVLIDGAHNEDGIRILQQFVDSLVSQYRKIYYCFSLKKGKSSALITDILGKKKNYLIVNYNSDLLLPVSDILQEFNKNQIPFTVQTPKDILSQAKANPDCLYVVFGSLYMIGQFYL